MHELFADKLLAVYCTCRVRAHGAGPDAVQVLTTLQYLNSALRKQSIWPEPHSHTSLIGSREAGTVKQLEPRLCLVSED